MTPPNPFTATRYGDKQFYYVTATDRIQAVSGFNRDQCTAALAMPELQKTVERALHRRLKLLDAKLQAAVAKYDPF